MADENGFDANALADAILNDREIPTGANSTPALSSDDSKGNQQADAERQAEVTATTEEPKEQEKPAQTADANDWLSNVAKIAGDEIKSEDDLKSLVEKARRAQDLESKHSTLSNEYEALKGNIPQFANDEVKKLNELLLGGATKEQVDAFNKIQSVGEIKDLKPIEQVKLALQLRDGLTAEEAEIRINRKYQLDEEVNTPEDITASMIDLKLDAKKDLEYLNGFKAEVSTAPKNNAAEQQAKLEAQEAQEIAEYRKNIEPVAHAIAKEFDAIKGVNLNGKTGDEALTVDIPISEEDKKQISGWVADYATVNQIPNTPEGIEHLKSYVNGVLRMKNFESMAIHINSLAEERLRAEFNNPASINRGKDAPRTSGEDVFANILEHVRNN